MRKWDGHNNINTCHFDAEWFSSTTDYILNIQQREKIMQKSFEKFTMKTVLPSPGPPSTTIIPPLVLTCSTISTAPTSSFDLPKNCPCSAPWCTSCSVTSDTASASSSSCHRENSEVFIWNLNNVSNANKHCYFNDFTQLWKWKWTNFHKQLHHSRPQILQHGLAEVLQVLQIRFSFHNASPLTRVTMTEKQTRSFSWEP